MNYKDLVKFIRENSTLTFKEINAALRNFGKFLSKSQKDKAPFMWKGVMKVSYVPTKETTRNLNGMFIKVPAKIKTKVKLRD